MFHLSVLIGITAFPYVRVLAFCPLAAITDVIVLFTLYSLAREKCGAV